MSESASVRVGRSPWTGERTAVYFIDQQQNILISKQKKKSFQINEMKKKKDPDVAAVNERMSSVAHKLLVLSGKGGVGSTFVSFWFPIQISFQF